VRVLTYSNYDEMSAAAARMIATRIAELSEPVLGLATGSTPIGMYSELARLHNEEGLDFSGTTTFNLDEYWGLDPDDPRSYHWFMKEHLFSRVNLDPAKTHVPRGIGVDPDAECERYEKLIEEAGGIDLQVLGIGMNGHIGFNEPGSDPNSRTRLVRLAQQTVDVNRAKGALDSLPGHALSMGIGTIMEAKEILLLANGQGKAEIIRRALLGSVTRDVPASLLQTHSNVVCMLDEPAAKLLDLS
jgi:glucosamine-6-phosphate deaminase